jgi:hypothetical protein
VTSNERSVEIRLAALDTIHRYAHCYDAGDFAALAELFTPDATFAVTPAASFLPEPLRGRQALVASFSGRYAAVAEAGIVRKHVCTNTVFDAVSAEAVRTRTYLTTTDIGPDGPALANTGVYHDVLVPADGGSWLIAERHLALDVSI